MKWPMLLSRTVASAAVFGFGVTTAQACVPTPADIFDDFATPHLAILTARVSQFEFFQDEDQVCLDVNYETLDVLFGAVQANFALVTCRQDATPPKTAAAYVDAFHAQGFQTGAEVLVGIVENPHAKEFRYMVPSCWGALHLRLDLLTPQERDDLLFPVRATFKND